jgi:hypothetical protein
MCSLLAPGGRDNQLVVTVGGQPGTEVCVLVMAVRLATCR